MSTLKHPAERSNSGDIVSLFFPAGCTWGANGCGDHIRSTLPSYSSRTLLAFPPKVSIRYPHVGGSAGSGKILSLFKFPKAPLMGRLYPHFPETLTFAFLFQNTILRTVILPTLNPVPCRDIIRNQRNHSR